MSHLRKRCASFHDLIFQIRSFVTISLFLCCLCSYSPFKTIPKFISVFHNASIFRSITKHEIFQDNEKLLYIFLFARKLNVDETEKLLKRHVVRLFFKHPQKCRWHKCWHLINFPAKNVDTSPQKCRVNISFILFIFHRHGVRSTILYVKGHWRTSPHRCWWVAGPFILIKMIIIMIEAVVLSYIWSLLTSCLLNIVCVLYDVWCVYDVCYMVYDVFYDLWCVLWCIYHIWCVASEELLNFYLWWFERTVEMEPLRFHRLGYTYIVSLKDFGLCNMRLTPSKTLIHQEIMVCEVSTRYFFIYICFSVCISYSSSKYPHHRRQLYVDFKGRVADGASFRQKEGFGAYYRTENTWGSEAFCVWWQFIAWIRRICRLFVQRLGQIALVLLFIVLIYGGMGV